MAWIKLHSQLLDSEVFASEKGLKIWIWLILKARRLSGFVPFKIGSGQSTIELKRGQLLFGRFTAEEKLGINGSTIYKWLKKFQELGMINIESNSHSTTISIVNYDLYNEKSNSRVTAGEQPSNSRVTAESPPPPLPSNTNKESKTDTEGEKDINSKTVIKKELKLTSSAPQADAVSSSENQKPEQPKEKPPKLTILAGAPPNDKTAEKEAGKNSLHIPMKKIFIDWYKKKKGIDYYWSGRDGKNLNDLIKKIHFTVPGTNDDGMLKGFEVFLQRIDTQNKFISENLNVSLLNSKFNELFANAKRGGQSAKADWEEICRIRTARENGQCSHGN